MLLPAELFGNCLFTFLNKQTAEMEEVIEYKSLSDDNIQNPLSDYRMLCGNILQIKAEDYSDPGRAAGYTASILR